MNHLSQYRNPITPHTHQTTSSHFSSTNCLQNFPSGTRFSSPNFMERVMHIPNDLSRYQIQNFTSNTSTEQIGELDKIQTMNSGNCYKPPPTTSTSNVGTSCTDDRNYISSMNDARNETVLNVGLKQNNCNDCFKIPTSSISTSTSPLVSLPLVNNKCLMIDKGTMTDPLTPEEQERLGQWEGFAAVQSGNKVAEYLTSLRQFLKLTPPSENKKRQGLGDVRIVTSPDGSRLFCCSECQMAYPDKTVLEQHLAQHKVERRFICTICGAGLKRKEHLDRHQLSHSTERPFTCAACPKTFKRNEHLARHYVIHSGEKQQVCTECGKAFFRRDHLQKHFQGHLTKRLRMAAMATS